MNTADTRQLTTQDAQIFAQFADSVRNVSWQVDRDFVRTGAFDKAFSRWLHDAFELRQESDYQELVPVSAAQAQEVWEHAQAFVAGVKAQLDRMMAEDEPRSIEPETAES